ncbi:MAG: pyridoxamine 5'-phosphate oxidase family protein [Actinomycetota bacterium]|nr:pyridoxamine 5'-phosphate oxidase family protein [Actinomycetota bacterium]
MPSRREQIVMTAGEITEFLNEERVLNVATIGRSGHPHVVAMWYALIDGDLAFWTFAKSQKVANLRRDARITGLVEAGDVYEELRGVEIVGTATLIDDYEALLDIGRTVAARYNGGVATSQQVEEFLAQQARKRIGVRIEAERFVSWDHRKLDRTY